MKLDRPPPQRGASSSSRVRGDGNDPPEDVAGDARESSPSSSSSPGNGVGNDGARKQSNARRTLEKLGQNLLGQQVSLRPTPEVPVGERAGKTASVRGRQGRTTSIYAAIDLGSSSAKMLVQRHMPDGSMRTLVDEKIGAALGKGVENGQPIPQENQERALSALRSFIEDAAHLGVKPGDISMITTAVVRNSSNGAAFVDAIHALGLARAKVLSGDEEAAMGYAGAVAMMHGAPSAAGTPRTPGKYATLDLGGGSFQLAVGTEKGIEAGGSTQIGSNLILDTMLAPAAHPDGTGDPAIFDVVDARLLKEAPLPLDKALLAGRSLVATGGISKFLRAHFGRDTISRAEIDALRRQVLVTPYAERAALVQTTAGGAPKDDDTKRALGVDTVEGAIDFGKKLPASSSLLLRILDGLGVDSIRVSETDARHALIAQAIAA